MPSIALRNSLTTAQVAQYHRDGYIVVPNLLDEKEVERFLASEIAGPQAVHQKRTRAVCIYMDGHGEVQRVTAANAVGDGNVPSRNDPY